MNDKNLKTLKINENFCYQQEQFIILDKYTHIKSKLNKSFMKWLFWETYNNFILTIKKLNYHISLFKIIIILINLKKKNKKRITL
jgi:hypothetical protein